jgi:hypothetical protein
MLTRLHAITDDAAPAKIQAAFAGAEMRSAWPIVKKIEAGLSYSDFPISIHDLDKQLSQSMLKTSEKIILKCAISRAGLLK